MSVGDEQSDVVRRTRDKDGTVVREESGTLTFHGFIKGVVAVAVTLLTGVLFTAFAFYVHSKTEMAVTGEKQEQSERRDDELAKAINSNTESVHGLTDTLKRLPTRDELEQRAHRATVEAVKTSQSYTDSQVAAARQESAQMARDISWIRDKQDEQSREIKDGFRALEKRISERER